MAFKQCKFTDFDGIVRGGIYVMTNGQVEDPENDYIICGCCGGIFQLDDVESYICYPSWLDISEEIIGE